MLFYDDAGMRETLNTLIRIGVVSEVSHEKSAARVVFEDEDEIVSGWLQVIQRNTLKNQDFALPDIGEDVICLFLSSGVEEGFILGSVYAGEIIPPKKATLEKRMIVFSDGTMIEYDRENHILTVKLENTKITAKNDKVVIKSPNIYLDGDVGITGTLTMPQSANISAVDTGEPEEPEEEEDEDEEPKNPWLDN